MNNPPQTPAIGHWCTGLEAALDALNSLSYPPWSRTQSLAMHASIMPSLLRKLDAVLVESLVADEGTRGRRNVEASISALNCAFSHSHT